MIARLLSPVPYVLWLLTCLVIGLMVWRGTVILQQFGEVQDAQKQSRVFAVEQICILGALKQPIDDCHAFAVRVANTPQQPKPPLR